VADRFLAAWLIRGSETAIRGRVLLDTHFEFRGGGSEGGERTGVRFATGEALQPFRPLHASRII
jgi:hypothetical protein